MSRDASQDTSQDTDQASGGKADHPITLTPGHGPVTVTVGGREVASTTRAVVLREQGYPAVCYVPREDVRMELLTRSGTKTHCPYKGDASYFAMEGEDVAWSYEDPLPGVGGVARHLAFDPAKATIDAGTLAG